MKFNAIIANLGEQYLEQVEDIVPDPPATLRYERLKNLSRDSDSIRVRKLLEGQEIGDKMPS